jgi:hypothetical protein
MVRRLYAAFRALHSFPSHHLSLSHGETARTTMRNMKGSTTPLSSRSSCTARRLGRTRRSAHYTSDFMAFRVMAYLTATPRVRFSYHRLTKAVVAPSGPRSSSSSMSKVRLWKSWMPSSSLAAWPGNFCKRCTAWGGSWSCSRRLTYKHHHIRASLLVADRHPILPCCHHRLWSGRHSGGRRKRRRLERNREVR